MRTLPRIWMSLGSSTTGWARPFLAPRLRCLVLGAAPSLPACTPHVASQAACDCLLSLVLQSHMAHSQPLRSFKLGSTSYMQ